MDKREKNYMRLSGLEPLIVSPESNFINIGVGVASKDDALTEINTIKIEGIEQILPIDMEEILQLLTGKRKNLSGFMQ